jgi:molecular chaperone DnaK (HSP70)
MEALRKAPVDVVADYLQRLWEHAVSTLKSRFGAAFFDNLQIKLVLTIPAIWDHQAQELTRKAAHKAGMMKRGNMKLELVSEPEAAARYVFSENLSLQVGDAFVVCDAGGGTIVRRTRFLKLRWLTRQGPHKL